MSNSLSAAGTILPHTSPHACDARGVLWQHINSSCCQALICSCQQPYVAYAWLPACMSKYHWLIDIVVSDHHALSSQALCTAGDSCCKNSQSADAEDSLVLPQSWQPMLDLGDILLDCLPKSAIARNATGLYYQNKCDKAVMHLLSKTADQSDGVPSKSSSLTVQALCKLLHDCAVHVMRARSPALKAALALLLQLC